MNIKNVFSNILLAASLMTHIEKLLDEYFLITMMDAAVPCTRDEENTHATGKVSLAAKSPPGRLENLLRQDGNVPEFKSDNRALFLRTPTKSPLDIP